MNPAGHRCDLLTSTALATCAKAVPRRGPRAIVSYGQCQECRRDVNATRTSGTYTISFSGGRAVAHCPACYAVRVEIEREPLALGGYIDPSWLRFGMMPL